MNNPLLDGIRKHALVTTEHVREGTPITQNMKEFLAALQPGDIILSKAQVEGKKLHDKVIRLLAKQYPWSHGGIYGGEGKFHHMFHWLGKLPLKQKIRTAQGRTHLLENIREKMKRDFLAVRPKGVTAKEQIKALEAAKKMMNTGYDFKDYLRAGLLPSKVEGKMVGGLPVKSICTGMVAHAYPQHSFSDSRARRHIRPSDIYQSPNIEHIMALSQ